VAGTLYGVRANVRDLLLDMDPDTPLIRDRRINRMIGARVQQLALEIVPGKAWSLAAVTLVANTADYTISGITVRQIEQLRLASDKRVLEKRTTEELAYMRQSAGTGPVTDYALWETALGVLTVGFYPTPNAADTVDRFGGVVPAAIRDDTWVVSSGTISVASLTAAVTVDTFDQVRVNDVITGTPGFITEGTYVTVAGSASVTTSAANLATFATTRLNFSSPIPFSDPMLRALEFDVAALCIDTMPDELLSKLGINRGLAQTLRGQAQQAVMLENRRRMETQRQRHLTLLSR